MSARTLQAERAELVKRLRRENPKPYRYCVVPEFVTPMDRAVEALEEIAQSHGQTLASIRGKGRFRAQVAAREECYFFLRARGWSLPQIGRFFNRDHTAVMYVLDPERNAERKSYLKKYYHLGRGT